MPVGLWNLEWLSHNAQRAYPVSADATGYDLSASFKLPSTFIVDMQLPISLAMNVNTAKFFIRYITNFAVGYSVVIGYDADEGPISVASALIPKSSHEPYTSYALGGIDDFDDSRGFIVIGDLADMDAQPGGDFEFDIDGTRLELEVIRPQIRGVASIRVVNGASKSARFYNDVELVAGTNCRLTTILEEDVDPQIRVDFIDGEGSVSPCLCDDADVAPPIRRINGIGGPDLTISVGSGLTLTTVNNGLKIEDLAAQPCCDCTQMEPIIADQKALGDRQRTLEAKIGELASIVVTTRDVILGSRLGDAGCTPD